MLPKNRRIERSLFSELLKTGRYANSAHFTVRFSPSYDSQAKIAVSVSKKVSKLAVTRNTVRRRVYAALSPILHTLPSYLFLIIAKPGAERVKGEELKIELKELFKSIEAIVS